MLVLYSAEVCPFAQRTRALLNRLNIEFELKEINLREKPEEFVEISPTGKVPLLRTDECLLYESQVINDYLADRYQWDRAYAEATAMKYRQQLAMKQWDSVVLEPFYDSLGDDQAFYEAEDEVRAELEVLDELVVDMEAGVDNLLSFHVATFWARMNWLSDYSPLPECVKKYDALAEWLKNSVDQPAIQATLPEKDATVESYVENYVE